MKTKLLLSALFGMAAWSLSSVAAASWDTGPCPQPHAGPAPCIEVEDDNNDLWHFNGSGGHAGVWHGHPLGGDFEFFDGTVPLECPVDDLNCELTLSGQVKKCLDSAGEWRIGVRVTGADVEAGDFLCNFVSVGGFPWYSKDPSITPHCPFEDNCDYFIPYDPSASTYTANFGSVDVSAAGSPLVEDGHLHNVVFTPGVGANFDFSNKAFFNCDEEDECTIDGNLVLDNAISLDIY